MEYAMYIIRETILRVFNLDGSLYWFYSVVLHLARTSKAKDISQQSPNFQVWTVLATFTSTTVPLSRSS
jgi:hypothetical protein